MLPPSSLPDLVYSFEDILKITFVHLHIFPSRLKGFFPVNSTFGHLSSGLSREVRGLDLGHIVGLRLKLT